MVSLLIGQLRYFLFLIGHGFKLKFLLARWILRFQPVKYAAMSDEVNFWQYFHRKKKKNSKTNFSIREFLFVLLFTTNNISRKMYYNTVDAFEHHIKFSDSVFTSFKISYYNLIIIILSYNVVKIENLLLLAC